MSKSLVLSGVSKSFGAVTAAERLDLSLEKGAILSLLGPSGCGKTTVLRLIAGFETPDEGTIEIDGLTVFGPGINLPPEKRRAGMVFQDYALFPHLDVYKNTAFGLSGNEGRKKTRAAEVLSLVGLSGLERRMPHQLSGGQQQRLALARAIAPGPGVMLLDEPFSNLDAMLRVQIRGEIRDILKRSGASAVFVTHDRDEAFFMGDRVSVMSGGSLEQTGTPYELFHRPETKFVAEFLGTADFIPCSLRDGIAETEIGPLPCPDYGETGAEGLHILVRPDDVTVTESYPEGNGEVSSLTFRGTNYVYSVKLDSGAVVHAYGPHDGVLARGVRVKAAFDPHYRPVIFKDEKRVGRSGKS
ncbi:MAG: ABC transporter ATP-binding protein [Candidatus Dadabacteria bacterium]|nr:ABC transporter ATP-binding protein [Candidatus Dadabacteria bacterium]